MKKMVQNIVRIFFVVLAVGITEDLLAVTRKRKKKSNMPGLQKDRSETTVSQVDSFMADEQMQDKSEEILQNQLDDEALDENDEYIEFNFENADLQNFIKQMEDLFEVTFLVDDAIQPLPAVQPPYRAVKGNKITFRTQKPLSREKAWDLFLSFLQMAGFAVVEQPQERFYRITTIENARKLPLRVFIGTDYQELPENDEIVRYIYFVDNSNLDTIKDFVDSIRSTVSTLRLLPEHKAFMLTDKSSNIRSVMEIVKELDKVSMPEVAVVLQLKQVEAKQVKDLYESLMSSEDKTAGAFGQRKSPTTKFFPEGTKIVDYPHGNKLILMGQRNKVEQLEDFITKYIDVEPSQQYSPFYVYPLKYADARTISEIMTEITTFGKDTEAGKMGGVRGSDQYLRPMSFVPEPSSNRLIIKGHYEDYLKAKEIIAQLDERQPQVGIEVLVISVNLDQSKSMGTQMRSKTPQGENGLLGNNIKFQTSGLFGTGTIQENKDPAATGTNRLLGNILNLVTGASPGNAILALGSDLFGVWGVFQVLETMTNAQVVSNPFLIATNKIPAEVSLGEIRRVATADVISGTSTSQALGDDPATLTVKITPQINSDGMIVLDIDVQFDNFVDTTNYTSATKTTRQVKTSAVVSDKQVLALGGLIKNTISNNENKVPILGDIPILGWLFKNKQKTQTKQNLLILISSRILESEEEGAAKRFTDMHVAEYDGTLDTMYSATKMNDPIHKMFFESKETDVELFVEDYIFERKKKENKIGAHRRRSKKKKNSEGVLKEALKEDLSPVHEENKSLVNRTNKQDFSGKQKPDLLDKQPALLSSQLKEQPSDLQAQKSVATNEGDMGPLIEKIKKRNRTQLSLSTLLKSSQEGGEA